MQLRIRDDKDIKVQCTECEQREAKVTLTLREGTFHFYNYCSQCLIELAELTELTRSMLN